MHKVIRAVGIAFIIIGASGFLYYWLHPSSECVFPQCRPGGICTLGCEHRIITTPLWIFGAIIISGLALVVSNRKFRRTK